MIIKGTVLGPAATNCFWLLDTGRKEAVIIDPGHNPEPVLAAVRGYTVRMILLTHGHWDHIAGLAAVHKATAAPIWISELEQDWLTDPRLNRSAFWPDLFPTPLAGPPADRLLREGDTFHFAGQEFHVLHVPGHTPGSLVFQTGNLCFAGDTLFQRSIGRTDLPGGDTEQLLQSIRDKLLVLPETTVVAPGHGPTTTIGEETLHNAFVGGAAGRRFTGLQD